MVNEKSVKIMDAVAKKHGYELNYRKTNWGEHAEVRNQEYDYYGIEITVVYKPDDDCNEWIEHFAVCFPGHGALDSFHEEKVMANLNNAYSVCQVLNDILNTEC